MSQGQSQRKRFFSVGLIGSLNRGIVPGNDAGGENLIAQAHGHSRRALLLGAARASAGAAIATVALDPVAALAKAAHGKSAAQNTPAPHAGSAPPSRVMRNAHAATRGPLSDDRRALAFVHLHTGEKLTVTYWSGGRYLPTALQDVNAILRDWRTDEITSMDPKLLDLLFQLRHRLRTDDAYRVICGYRCPKTNAMLAAHSDGVAARSLHMDGMAIDIDVASRPLNRIRDAALSLKLGGVGYYPRSNFVHVDTGRVRQWA